MSSARGRSRKKKEPFFNPMPESILISFGVLAGIELILLGGNYGLWGGPEAVGWRVSLIETYGFSDPLFESMVTFGLVSWDKLVRCLSFVFFSSSSFEAVFSCLLFLAVGKYVADRTTVLTILVFFFLTTLASSIGFSLILDTDKMLTGALSVSFGLLAFYGVQEAVKAKRSGRSVLLGFRLPIMIIGIDIAFSYFLSQPPFWVARAAAFVVGLVLSFFVAKDGTLSFRAAQWYLGRK